MTCVATERVCEAFASVTVGYFGKPEEPRPSVPAGYHLQLLDVASTSPADDLEICLVSVTPDDAGTGLRRVRAAVGDMCFVVAYVRDGLGVDWMPRLLDLGADDVLSETTAHQLRLVLKKAEKAADLRKRMQQSVSRVEAERDILQAAIDNLPSPIFFKNRQGIYSGCNTAFTRYIGLPADQVKGASVYDVAPADLAKVYEDADEKLMRKGGSQFYEAKVRYASGEERHVMFSKAVTRDQSTGEVNGLAGAMLDITERKELEEQLRRAAEFDHLTGAFNRRKFFKSAGEAEAEARENGAGLAVLVIDVDNFKSINDRHGHAIGDSALCHLVEQLGEHLSEGHFFARAGGEEFFVLLRDCDVDQAAAIAESIRRRIETSIFSESGVVLSYHVSIGVAALEPDETVSSALMRADKALYRAKEVGRNRVFVA